MLWYSHLLQYFPQFIVVHTVKGFGIVNKAEIDVFLELSFFLVALVSPLFCERAWPCGRLGLFVG